VEQWRRDPVAAAEIEAHLKSNGVDAAAINVEVFVQARDLLVLFDSLMLSAQSRRIALFALGTEPSYRFIAENRCSSRHCKATSRDACPGLCPVMPAGRGLDVDRWTTFCL
jgi:hypothetical protein